MKVVIVGGLLIASVMWGNNACAAGFVAGNLAQADMTYTTLAQVQTSRTSSYSGVGSLFVSTASTATTGIGSLCSGALVGAGTVLTAAHCLETSASNPITSIKFYLPSFGERTATGTNIFSATAFAINPGFELTGITGGNDVALFSIAGDTSAFDKYGLFLGDPLQQYTEVGTGTIGGPQGTNVGVSSDYEKRVGSNIYEYLGNEVFEDVSAGVALYDFDDGTESHDVFGQIGGNVQTGILGESAASPGDSGGPEFINGQIASVTSFGITGGIFNGYCGADSIDPYNQAGSTAQTALSGCTNSSVGEIGGNTLVSYNLGFIQGYIDGLVPTVAPVPELGTWAMMILGMGAVGSAMRRRQKVSTTVQFA